MHSDDRNLRTAWRAMVLVQSQKQPFSFLLDVSLCVGYAKESSKVDFINKSSVGPMQWSLQKKADCVEDNERISQSVENYL